MKKILSIKVIDWQGCQGADASAPQNLTTTVLYVGETLREMDGKWKNLYIFFIEVDLWLILFFFKVENSGGMGDVLESRSFMK